MIRRNAIMTVLCLGLAMPLSCMPVAAETLGRMTLALDGRPKTYKITDAPDSASGWVSDGTTTGISLVWNATRPDDTLLLQLTMKDGTVTSARLEAPDMETGPMAADAPGSLSVTIRKTETQGDWMKISGPISGVLTSAESGGERKLAFSGGFSTWVPRIGAAVSKPGG